MKEICYIDDFDFYILKNIRTGPGCFEFDREVPSILGISFNSVYIIMVDNMSPYGCLVIRKEDGIFIHPARGIFKTNNTRPIFYEKIKDPWIYRGYDSINNFSGIESKISGYTKVCKEITGHSFLIKNIVFNIIKEYNV